MEHEPSLIPNFTFFIQMGIFFASWGVLHFLVFKPYVALIESRNAQTEGLAKKQELDQVAAQELRSKYESFMKDQRKAVSDFVEEGRRKTAEEERAVVQKARGEASEILKSDRTKIAKDYETTRKELMPRLAEYSGEIVSKVLGRKVTVPASHVSARSFDVQVPG